MKIQILFSKTIYFELILDFSFCIGSSSPKLVMYVTWPEFSGVGDRDVIIDDS